MAKVVTYVRNGVAMPALVLQAPAGGDDLVLAYLNEGDGSDFHSPVKAVTTAFSVPPLAEGKVNGWKPYDEDVEADAAGKLASESLSDDLILQHITSQIGAHEALTVPDNANLGRYFELLSQVVAAAVPKEELEEAQQEITTLKASLADPKGLALEETANKFAGQPVFYAKNLPEGAVVMAPETLSKIAANRPLAFATAEPEQAAKPDASAEVKTQEEPKPESETQA